MAILNYSTKISADRTAGEVQAMLGKAGAATVATTYERGEVSGVSFVLDTVHGRRGYVLPVQADAVRRVLVREEDAGRLGRERRGTFTSPAHARRVAWRIAKDWLEAQLALVDAELASLDQVMLPYMLLGDGRTVYDALRSPTAAFMRALEGGPA